jgi:hypothetical protein
MISDNKKRISVMIGGGIVLIGLVSVKLLLAKDTQAFDQSAIAKASLVASKASGLVTTQVKATLPPLPSPLINSISEGKRQITIRNSLREPVRTVAQIEVTENVYGNGLLKFKNVSGKNLAALRGEFVITTDNGDVLKDGWSFSSFRSRGFTAAGISWEVPVSGPVQSVVTPPHKIARITVRITGAVYDDGSYWGPDGLGIRQKVSLEAKNTVRVCQAITCFRFAERMEGRAV